MSAQDVCVERGGWGEGAVLMAWLHCRNQAHSDWPVLRQQPTSTLQKPVLVQILKNKIPGVLCPSQVGIFGV